MQETKECCRCGEFKEFSEFNKSKKGRLGLHNHCRACQKEVRHAWYLKHREEELAKGKIYAKSEKGKAEAKIQYERNKDKILERNRIRRRTPHARKLANIARKKRLEEDMSFRISMNLRARVREEIKRTGNGAKKPDTTFNLLGCTIEEFRAHLESKFQEGMTWENYGVRGWHIDHIKPCHSFDLTQEDQVRECFHYTNMQPLWWRDNLSKGIKL